MGCCIQEGGCPEVSGNGETPGPRFHYLQKETTVPEKGYDDDVRPAPPRVQPRGGELGCNLHQCGQNMTPTAMSLRFPRSGKVWVGS